MFDLSRDKRVKVLVADDHQMLVDYVSWQIKQDFIHATVYEANSLDHTVKQLEQVPEIDLLILDLKMPGMCGMESVKMFIETYPNIPILINSGACQNSEIKAYLDMGVHGYFPKSANATSLRSAIRAVVLGERYVPENVISEGGDHLVRKGVKKLTKAELTTLELLAAGYSNPEIGKLSNRTEATIKVHVRNLFKKMGVSNRVQAANLYRCNTSSTN